MSPIVASEAVTDPVRAPESKISSDVILLVTIFAIVRVEPTPLALIWFWVLDIVIAEVISLVLALTIEAVTGGIIASEPAEEDISLVSILELALTTEATQVAAPLVPVPNTLLLILTSPLSPESLTWS